MPVVNTQDEREMTAIHTVYDTLVRSGMSAEKCIAMLLYVAAVIMEDVNSGEELENDDIEFVANTFASAYEFLATSQTNDTLN